MSTAEQLITGEQVAERLGLSRQRVHQLAGRFDFPPPAGRVGKATVWRTGDVDNYASGIRAFVAINGIAISRDQAVELAARLRRQQRTQNYPAEARRVAGELEQILDTGGAITATGAEASAIFTALQKWLEQVSVDVFGERLMTLRYSLYATLQDSGLIPR